jgi:PAS domain S-box-containing protein
MTKLLNPAIRLMDRLTYPRKLAFVSAIVLAIIIFQFIALYQQLNKIIVDSTIQLKGVEQIVAVNELIQLAQQYRGLSVVNVGDSTLFTKRYSEKIQETERAFYNVINSLDPTMSLITAAGNNLNGASDLSDLWENLKKEHKFGTVEKDFTGHTYLIRQLRLLLAVMGDHYLLITGADLPSYYMVEMLLNNIPNITESMGRIRAIVLGVLSSKQLSVQKRRRIAALESKLEQSVEDFKHNITKVIRYSPELTEVSNLVYLQLHEDIQSAIKLLNDDIYSGKFNTSSNDYFLEITANIDNLYDLMTFPIVPSLTSHIEQRINSASSSLNLVIIVAAILLLLTLYFLIALYKSLLSNISHISEVVNKYSDGHLSERIKLNTQDEMRDISLSINEMASRLYKSGKLLTFQQKALDQHAIVSATDVTGNIIYVNDKFEQISQYSRVELMGNNHRLLSSGFHSASFFKEMWRTIANGEVWNGEIKNKAKDGSFYWVSATIVPQLNEQGKPEQYIALRTDITEIKAFESQQMEANKLLQTEKNLTEKEKKKAEKANNAKSEFLSSMSHELRTPLNAILGFAQLLQMMEKPPLTEDQQHKVDYILSSGKHLLSLVNNVLELSAIEAGKAELNMAPVNVIDVINDSISLLTPLAHKTDIKIQVLSDLALTIYADYTKLQQVILNLVSNAIKYNQQGGSVSLKWVKVKTNALRISVIDTGIGISEDSQDKVFDAFNRLGQETSTIEGTGIGLVVTKELVEIMGGKIGFDSVENKGSTFWFELPIFTEDLKKFR